MKFKLDENLPFQLKDLLTEAGHEAATVLDQGMGGATDSDVLSVCIAEDRVLVTQDIDFADLRLYPPGDHPGIVVFRLTNQARGTVLRIGERLTDTLVGMSPRGQLWIVEDSRIRVRD